MTKRNQFTDIFAEIDWFGFKEAVKTTFLDIFKMKVTRSGKTKIEEICIWHYSAGALSKASGALSFSTLFHHLLAYQEV